MLRVDTQSIGQKRIPPFRCDVFCAFGFRLEHPQNTGVTGLSIQKLINLLVPWKMPILEVPEREMEENLH